MTAPRTAHVVTVAFRTHPGRGADFLPLMRENARASVADEPGCLRFDVCLPVGGEGGGDGSEVFLYELYADRAAFDAHLASPHYRAFDAATRDMVAEKRVAHYETETP